MTTENTDTAMSSIQPRPRVFALVWLGQLVSLLGSGMSEFVLGLWIYRQTGSVTQFAFAFLFKALPVIVLSPLAGMAADRRDRRRVMLLSDAGAAMATLAAAALFFTGRLEVWHVYLATAFSAACGAFQLPAYQAATTLLVGKRSLGRANGMLQMGQAAADILAPAFAATGLGGVLILDAVTFLFAVTTLALSRFPNGSLPEPMGEAALRSGALSGWAYLTRRPGLIGLLCFFAFISFVGGMITALLVPMVLGFADSGTLGILLSIAGSGLLVGSLLLATWGGPRRRVDGLLGFGLLLGLCILMMGLRPIPALVTLAAFGAHFSIPFLNGLNQTIWQSKVAPEVQGRVFAIRQMLTRAAQPLAFLLAGVLADRVFEPLLQSAGLLSGSLGRLVGVGPGRGIGMMFVLMGIAVFLGSMGAYADRSLRRVEAELADAIPG